MNERFKYNRSTTSKQIQVILDGKKVGDINPVAGGFAYKPLNSKTTGEVFATVALVKRSIEEP